ncbi:hypothetical protein PybrP1_000082 [[Pythium] brassicae (nom. inval.)]|nr:hypothetical protein PybrP1_000082 [[Pythium] brassicae (nom. inval.)]
MGCRNDDVIATTAATSKTPVPDKWDASKIPSLKNKIAVVTGANSGIGYVTARELARNGADVVLALESVKRFVDSFKRSHTRLDLLINNAGIMAVPYALTVDGIESQFATNHLGHFALTAQLFDLLTASAPSRVVNVSSVMHRFSSLKPEAIASMKLMPAEDYSRVRAYNDSKLSNLLFTAELTRRLRACGIEGVTALAAHPGFTATNLLGTPSTSASWFSWFSAAMWGVAKKLKVGQSVEVGALPTLFAATAPNASGGDFFGPKHLFTLMGAPVLEDPSSLSKSEELAARLWVESERLAEVSFVV